MMKQEDFSRLNQVEQVKYALLAMQRNCWDQGEAMQASEELGDEETLILLARQAVSRQTADGRAGVLPGDMTVTDPCSCGAGILRSYQLTGDPLFKQSLESLSDWIHHKAPRNSQGVIYHLIHEPQFWVDSMFMLPPFLAAIGELDEAMRQVNGYWQVLYREQWQLLSTIWDDQRGEFVREAPRGIGNGYAILGMYKVASLLDDAHQKDRDLLVKRMHLIVDGMLACREPNGVFRDVLNRPDSYVAMNGAQMLAAGIYRMVQAGWLDKSYLAQADCLREDMLQRVDSYGYVQGVCGAPTFRESGSAPNGQAFFLMMEAAYRDLKEARSA